MALTCKQAIRISLGVLGGHALEAERLELEEHLASCARCGEEHVTVLALVRGLGAVEPDHLTPAARDSVRQALATRGPAGTTPAPRSSGAWRMGVGLSLAGAAIAVVAVILFGRGTFRADPDGVIGGDVTVTRAVTGAADGSMVFRSVGGGRIRLADASVDLDGDTEIDWHRGFGRLDLRQGGVTVDVPHRPGQHFEIWTPRFTVAVVGTRFKVDLMGVRTERGAVQVIRPDGSIAARVEAGQSWTVGSSEAVAAAEAVAVASARPSGAQGHASRVLLDRPVRAPVVPAVPDRGGDGRARASIDSSLGERLGKARRALARGDASGARRILSPLFHLGREVGVEARILFAESFLVEGRYADAMDGYRVVARDFPGTSQAESSEFALAQLASEHGRTADARAALEAYLGRYPHGRFAREAADRLVRLSGAR